MLSFTLFAAYLAYIMNFRLMKGVQVVGVGAFFQPMYARQRQQ